MRKAGINYILNRPDIKSNIIKASPILKWNEAVGAEISKNTAPIKVTKAGVLHVKVSDSALMVELSMLKTQIISNLNNLSEVGFISDIIFKR